MVDLLTSNLRLEIEKTNIAFSRWTENKLSWLQHKQLNFVRQQEECQCTMNTLYESNRELDELKLKNDSIRLQQQAEVDRYVKQIEKLQSHTILLEQQLDSFSTDDTKASQQLNELTKEYNDLKSKSTKSMNELTHGIRFYLHLGLEFQKAPNDCMKFIFTNIDEKAPARQFYFMIFVDEKDSYQFVESNPVIDGNALTRLMERLNADSNISRFVVSMRSLFVKSLQ